MVNLCLLAQEMEYRWHPLLQRKRGRSGLQMLLLLHTPTIVRVKCASALNTADKRKITVLFRPTRTWTIILKGLPSRDMLWKQAKMHTSTRRPRAWHLATTCSWAVVSRNGAILRALICSVSVRSPSPVISCVSNVVGGVAYGARQVHWGAVTCAASGSRCALGPLDPRLLLL